MKWQDKLTKDELKHCIASGAKTLGGAIRNAEHQNSIEFPCWICVSIGRKLGAEITLNAFHKLQMKKFLS